MKENQAQTRDILLQLDPHPRRRGDAAPPARARLERDGSAEAGPRAARHGRPQLRRAVPHLLRGARAARAALLGEGRRRHHHQGAREVRLHELGERQGLRLRPVPGARALRARRGDEPHGPALLPRPLRLPDGGEGRGDPPHQAGLGRPHHRARPGRGGALRRRGRRRRAGGRRPGRRPSTSRRPSRRRGARARRGRPVRPRPLAGGDRPGRGPQRRRDPGGPAAHPAGHPGHRGGGAAGRAPASRW